MSRRLTVLNVAYALAPVGPDAVGGAEQVLSAIDRGLVAAGHRSLVVACGGSSVAGELVGTGVDPEGALDDASRQRAEAATRQAIASVLEREAVDVIHLHGLDFRWVLPADGPPALVTLHLPLDWYEPRALVPWRARTWLHGVSAAQWRGCPQGVAGLAPIGNGVPVDALDGARHARRGCALTLGRVCFEKGQHLALRAAHRADVPLLVAGAVFGYPAHRAFFDNEVAPLLDRRRRFLGPVGFARKRRLLSAARCLLLPSLAAETSSLVAMEAAACGTPVVAFRSGALPDIVADGVTGFVVDDPDAMAAAIGRVGTIDPEACRARARALFTVERMVDAYVERYRTLAS